MTEAGQIVVDLGQLRLTGSTLESDTELDLKPGLAYTGLKIQHWVQFGAKSPSGEVEAARQAFIHMLSRYADNFENHVLRVERAVRFLDQTAANYTEADELMAVNVDAVKEMLNEALVSPPPTPPHGHMP